ncbi:MAG: hypothetical protein AAF206_05455 [Bacteroidota bacterium]
MKLSLFNPRNTSGVPFWLYGGITGSGLVGLAISGPWFHFEYPFPIFIVSIIISAKVMQLIQKHFQRTELEILRGKIANHQQFIRHLTEKIEEKMGQQNLFARQSVNNTERVNWSPVMELSLQIQEDEAKLEKRYAEMADLIEQKYRLEAKLKREKIFLALWLGMLSWAIGSSLPFVSCQLVPENEYLVCLIQFILHLGSFVLLLHIWQWACRKVSQFFK